MPTIYTIAGLDSFQHEGTGDGADLTFTVSRTGDLSQSGSINYAISPWANNPTNPDDFESPLSGTVSFGAGQASQVLTIHVKGDSTAEADEGFNVLLDHPVNGQINAPWSPGTYADGMIFNDDKGQWWF